MSAKRKSLRARRSAPELPEPTENQIEEAMVAFERAKVRHQLIEVDDRIAVRVSPEMLLSDEEFERQPIRAKVPAGVHLKAFGSFSIKYFSDEACARQWREREIIREAITAGMRAKP